MSKEGYQPIKMGEAIKITPPSTSSNVQMKKDGYTWKDLDKAWWEGFDNAKNKMEKRIEELEEKIENIYANHCGNCNRNILNSELKEENAKLKEINTHTLSQLNLDNGELITQLTKARKIIQNLLQSQPTPSSMYEETDLISWRESVREAEQFIKNSEVEK